MREFEVAHQCALSAEMLWSLRSDIGFDEWYAKTDHQVFTLESNDRSVDDAGIERINRQFRLSQEEEHVPRSLRIIMPKSKEFCSTVKANFYPHNFDQAHPYS